MIKIDLKRGFIRADDSLFDLAADNLDATHTTLHERLELHTDEYSAHIDLGEGVLQAGATHNLPADGYEVGEVSTSIITLRPYGASA